MDLIVAFEDTSIAAAQAATADPANRIPVVFLHPSDPVRDGLVESLAHPGGNLTGAFGARDPVAKQLELYREILPGPAAAAPAHARRSDRQPRDAAAPHRGARCRRQARDRAGRTRGVRRRRSAGRLRVAHARLGRRRVHPVAQPAAQLLDEDPRARGGGEPPRPGPPPRMGRPAEERQGRAVLARRRPRAGRNRRREVRRQHPEGRQARRPARPGGAEGRVRHQPEARRGARHHGAAGRRRAQADVVYP